MSEYRCNPVTGKIVEIDPDQAWFWETNWFSEELEAEKEFASGKYEEFDSIEELIARLARKER